MIKEKKATLHLLTKETIEGLSEEQVLELLRLKWIAPLAASLRIIPDGILSGFTKQLQLLAEKYAETFLETDTKIQDTEKRQALKDTAVYVPGYFPDSAYANGNNSWRRFCCTAR